VIAGAFTKYKNDSPPQEGGCRGMDGKEIRVQAHRVLGEVRCVNHYTNLTEIQNDLEPFSSRPSTSTDTAT